MRTLAGPLLAFVLLSACIGSPGDLDDPSDGLAAAARPTTLIETYAGTVLSASTPVITISPDQLGDVERWFWVHDNTTKLELHLQANAPLDMYLFAPGCHDWGCTVLVSVRDAPAHHIIDDPASGGYEVVFFTPELGLAPAIDYTLTVVKDQTHRPAIEREIYAGTAVALNAAAFRISPDQLGDVYREFYVHENTMNLTFRVTTNEDFAFVIGQSNPSRDSSSEEYHYTQGGSLHLTIEGPHVGGWYFIVFARDEVGYYEIGYEVEIDKHYAE